MTKNKLIKELINAEQLLDACELEKEDLRGIISKREHSIYNLKKEMSKLQERHDFLKNLQPDGDNDYETAYEDPF